MPVVTALTLLCCPGEVQGLLSQVLQLLGVGVGSPTLMTTEPALSPASGVDGCEGGLSPSPMPVQDK